MGIHKKILEIMKSIEYVKKDDTISYPGKDGRSGVSYKGLSEEKITKLVRDAMVTNGVIVFPIAQAHRREGMLSTVDTTYRFVDTEDDSFIEVVSSGTGVDTQDKGVGKAMTYAFKYLFLRTFAIPTGDDPDKISSAELDERQRETEQKKTAQPSADQAPSTGSLYSDTIVLLNEEESGAPIFTNRERIDHKKGLDAVSKNADELKKFHATIKRAIDDRRKKLLEQI